MLQAVLPEQNGFIRKIFCHSHCVCILHQGRAVFSGGAKQARLFAAFFNAILHLDYMDARMLFLVLIETFSHSSKKYIVP